MVSASIRTKDWDLLFASVSLQLSETLKFLYGKALNNEKRRSFSTFDVSLLSKSEKIYSSSSAASIGTSTQLSRSSSCRLSLKSCYISSLGMSSLSAPLFLTIA